MTLMSVAMGTFDNKHVIMAQILECCQQHLKLQEFTDLLEQQTEAFLDFLTSTVKIKTLSITFTGIQMTPGPVFKMIMNGKWHVY